MNIKQIDTLIPRSEVVGERVVPENWLLFNAPRPLAGHIGWEGEWISGRWYAAVDPTDTWAQEYIRDNISLDARLLRFITEADVRAFFSKECEAYGADPETFEYTDMLYHYYANSGERIVEL